MVRLRDGGAGKARLDFRSGRILPLTAPSALPLRGSERRTDATW